MARKAGVIFALTISAEIKEKNMFERHVSKEPIVISVQLIDVQSVGS